MKCLYFVTLHIHSISCSLLYASKNQESLKFVSLIQLSNVYIVVNYILM